VIELLKQNKELFDLFTRREEYNTPLLDKYQRFLHCLSRHGNIFQPEVSKFLIDNGLTVDYPEGRKFAVCLTHDIDFVNFSKSEIFFGSSRYLINSQPTNALKMLFYIINKKRNPRWNFKDIMSLEEEYGAKSSFYFLALDKEDEGYNFEIQDLENELGTIGDKGWEVGLHGGHNAYNNFDEIEVEKKRLEKVSGKKVIGYRNHFLKFKVPDTWELLGKAGFKYDATLGYVDCVGFRSGMCHPFKPFNLDTNREIDILEIPLTIMDTTLFDYMKLDVEGAWNITKLLIDIVEKYEGVITILFHNTDVTKDNFNLYKNILEYCYSKRAWMTSGEEIANHLIPNFDS
jgi:peptidoglycan/xylan/chitin deacetylase (PgdA/CDA1 family)